MLDNRYLDMKASGAYIGQSYRWMQRHWVDLVKAGVAIYRVPKDSIKGRLVFSKESLDEYMRSCRLTLNVTVE